MTLKLTELENKVTELEMSVDLLSKLLLELTNSVISASESSSDSIIENFSQLIALYQAIKFKD
jgi:uncharacterized coiled-coil protein SlyX